jgi:hypothetical protein
LQIPFPTCRPVQDNNCRDLIQGERVTALYSDGGDPRYYDAIVVDAERQEHGTGECKSCFFFDSDESKIVFVSISCCVLAHTSALFDQLLLHTINHCTSQ